MKKFLLILSILFTITLRCITSAYASTNIKLSAAEALDLLTELSVELPQQSDEEPLTRAQFTYTLMQILSGGYDFSGQQSISRFSDVYDTQKESGAISAAKDMGIVSDAEYFYPDESILPDEAVKMLVTACGYSMNAEQSGGYPSGYRAIAQHLGLTSGLDMSAASLSYESFSSLLANTLNIDIQIITKHGNNRYSVKSERGNTLLTEYFDLQPITGIVTANHITSLYDPQDGCDHGLEIDNIPYYSEKYDKFLGFDVSGYYRNVNDKNNIVFLKPKSNKSISVEYDKIVSLNLSELQYFDSAEKRRHVNIADNATVIYNGKSLPKPEISDFSVEYGKVDLLDNNNDNVYDVIFIQNAQTLLIKSTDNRNLRIYDSHASYSIDGSDEECIVHITLNGKKAEFSALKAGMTATCYVSKDGKMISIDASDETVSGTPAYNIANKKIKINDSEYFLTPYFEKYYSSLAVADVNTTFAVDAFNRIVSIANDNSQMKYGYIVNAAKTSALDTEYIIRLFTQDGKMQDIKLANKVTVDDRVIDAEAFYSHYIVQNGGVKMQLIRYKLNPNNMLRYIDTIYSAQNNSMETSGYISENSNPYDSLSIYNYKKNTAAGTLYAKPSLGIVSAHFYVPNSAPIFIVITGDDVSDDERCYVTSLSSLFGDYPFSTSRLSVYDVKTSGTAGALVYQCSMLERYGTLGDGSTTGLICSISEAVDEEGAEILHVDVYTLNREVETYFIKDKTLLESLYTDEDRAHSELSISPGDYIRFMTDSNKLIINITKDFDASSMTLLYSRTGENDQLRYYYGTAYDSEKGIQSIASATVATPIDDPASPVYCLNIPSVAVVFDSVSKTIYPIPATEIVNHIQDPGNADKLLAVTRYIDCRALVIYR